MPHVHNISSDEDELEEGDWGYEEEGERRPIPWIPIASAGAAVVLVGILVFLLFGGGGGSKQTATTTTASTVAPLPALAATDPRVVAAQAALDAWGTFEGTGKIADLGTTMDPKGPQYKALEKEAAANQLSGKYTAVVTNPRQAPLTDAQIAVGEQVVRADVVWKRDGRADQTVTWDLVLRPRSEPPGLWLWTARAVTDDSTGGSAAGGDFCTTAKSVAGVPTNKDLLARLQATNQDAEQVAIAQDSIKQRAAADAQIAASAPTDIKAKADAVAAGSARYQELTSGVTSYAQFESINAKAEKDKVYAAGIAARPEVNAFVQQTCGVNIDPAR